MHRGRWWFLLLGMVLACADGSEDAEGAQASGAEPTPAMTERARAPVDSVPAAEPAATRPVAAPASPYDTVVWNTPEEARVRGSVVFSYSCAQCHGRRGHGDGAFVTDRGDTLRPASFHDPDWPYADDLDALRLSIYGGEGDASHPGMDELRPRDVDAVARYILESLRPAEASGATGAR